MFYILYKSTVFIVYIENLLTVVFSFCGPNHGVFEICDFFYTPNCDFLT